MDVAEGKEFTRQVDLERLNNAEFRQCNKLITNARFVPSTQGKSGPQMSVADKRTRFSLLEQRLIYFLATQICNAQPEEIGGGVEGKEDTFQWWFTTRDVAEGCGLPLSCKAHEIRKIVGKLRNTEILIEDDNGKAVTQTSFVLKSKWTGTGEVCLVIDKGILPFYHRLAVTSNFTPFLLRYINSLKSVHGVNLYMYLKYRHNYAVNNGHVHNGEVKIDVDLNAIKKVLHVDEVASYNRFGSFRQRVLDKAQMEINDKTDLCFDYTPLTERRSVNRIRFTVRVNEGDVSGGVNQRLMELTDATPDQVRAAAVSPEEIIELLAKVGVQESTSKLFIRQFEDNLLGLYAVGMYTWRDAKEVKNVYHYVKDLMVKFDKNPSDVLGALKYYHERIESKAARPVEQASVHIDLSKVVDKYIQHLHNKYTKGLDKAQLEVEFNQRTMMLLEQESIAEMEELTAIYYETGGVRDLSLKRKLAYHHVRDNGFEPTAFQKFIDSSLEWGPVSDEVINQIDQCEALYNKAVE